MFIVPTHDGMTLSTENTTIEHIGSPEKGKDWKEAVKLNVGLLFLLFCWKVMCINNRKRISYPETPSWSKESFTKGNDRHGTVDIFN